MPNGYAAVLFEGCTINNVARLEKAEEIETKSEATEAVVTTVAEPPVEATEISGPAQV